MYTSKLIEMPEVLPEARQVASASRIDWDALRTALAADADADTYETPQERLVVRLERVLGPAGFDLELSLGAAEPYIVGCRLTIDSAVRSSVSDPFATPSEASGDAVRKAAELFRLPL